MFRAAFWLTLATVLGLAAGFAREWLLVAAWGAGARTDAFLVAMFLPEAVRMMLAGGVIASAALPVYRMLAPDERPDWLYSQMLALALLGGLAGVLLHMAAPWLVRVIGPGLDPAASRSAAACLQGLAWTVPLLLLHALSSVVLQARERFVLVGMASLLYNLPAVLYLALRHGDVEESGLSMAFVAGAVLMLATVLPAAWRDGWRAWRGKWMPASIVGLYAKVGVLLLSASASQGLALLERMCASWLGEGAITVINLARKLVNLPLVALMSLNQVALARMSAHAGNVAGRQQVLRVGLIATAAMIVPAAAGMVGAAPALVHWFLPHGMADGALPMMLAWFAAVSVAGACNALLARYAYAAGDTALPTRCELLGSALNAVLLVALSRILGLPGIALAALAGCLFTGALLFRAYRLPQLAHTAWLLALAVVPLVLATLLFHSLRELPVWQFALACVHSLLWLGLYAAWLRRMLRVL